MKKVIVSIMLILGLFCGCAAQTPTPAPTWAPMPGQYVWQKDFKPGVRQYVEQTYQVTPRNTFTPTAAPSQPTNTPHPTETPPPISGQEIPDHFQFLHDPIYTHGLLLEYDNLDGDGTPIPADFRLGMLMPYGIICNGYMQGLTYSGSNYSYWIDENGSVMGYSSTFGNGVFFGDVGDYNAGVSTPSLPAPWTSSQSFLYPAAGTPAIVINGTPLYTPAPQDTCAPFPTEQPAFNNIEGDVGMTYEAVNNQTIFMYGMDGIYVDIVSVDEIHLRLATQTPTQTLTATNTPTITQTPTITDTPTPIDTPTEVPVLYCFSDVQFNSDRSFSADRYMSIGSSIGSATICFNAPRGGSITRISGTFNVATAYAGAAVVFKIRVDGADVFESGSTSIATTGDKEVSAAIQDPEIDTIKAGESMSVYADITAGGAVSLNYVVITVEIAYPIATS